MPDLGTIPGAAVVIDDDYVLREGNNRCEIVFKEPFGNVRGASLDELHDRGLFDQTAKEWLRRAVRSVVDGTEDEQTTQVVFTPGGAETEFAYDLRVMPTADRENAAVCTLRSVNTRQRYDETVTALHAATRELMTADDVESALRLTAEAASDVLGFPGTGARRYDEQTGTLHHVALGARINNIETRPPYDVDTSPHGRALRNEETVIDDIAGDDPFDREVFTQTMYVPIGQTGLLSLGVVGQTFDEVDIQFAEILAENAEAAIREIRTRNTLRRERERLDRFASVVSHDLRSPITTASGYLERARITGDDEDFAGAERALERMDRMVDDLLAMARVDTIKDTSTVSIAAVTRDAWDTAATGEATLDIRLGDEVVQCDRSLLQNLLENLFRNAVDHNESAPTIRVGQVDGDGRRVNGFYVEDDGTGIPEPDWDSVFEYGFTTSEDGTGFGLSIVAEIATVHGWEVSVTDSPRGGARFEILTETAAQ